MATWWQCAILLVIAAFFGWVISQGLKSTSPDVWGHVIIPPYAVLLYVVAAALVNRRRVVVTREHMHRTCGPIPLGAGRLLILQQKVECAFYSAITGVTDDGDTFVLGYMVGLQTRAGRDVELFGPFKSESAATESATQLAEALSTSNRVIDVRGIGEMKEDPGDRRRAWTWGIIVATAFVAGIVWEIVVRAGR